ncbi:unnamed protein product [Coffea canephora]|uniref:non-specific serine/threonine protein kinase n=1 Tax=Coffea canephora TaxID=49390 RepID=A0A068UGV9_COFCA|nr:unnamed protein product [Coffea canephora]
MEVLQDEQAITGLHELSAGFPADWRSIGIILFELLIGFPPFTTELPEALPIFLSLLNKKRELLNYMLMSNQSCRFLDHGPDLRLGAKGASEVKAHPLFTAADWDNLALQKVSSGNIFFALVPLCVEFSCLEWLIQL